MKTRLLAPPWTKPTLTDETSEALEIISSNVWKDASVRFSAERDAKIKAGKSAPKGMQRYLNEILVERFKYHGWDGDSGYFIKEKTWIRVTFRHQMSLGSDILDALKVCKKEGIEQAVILAANRKTLNIISPNDAAAIVSFEKLEKEILSLYGALDIPLLIGELTPLTSASKDVEAELKKERYRDLTIPTRQ